MPLYKPVGSSILLLNGSVGTSTTFVMNNTVITAPFSELRLFFSNFSHDDAGSQSFRLELSADNGSSFSSTVTIATAVANTTSMSGDIRILNTAASASSARIIRVNSSAQTSGTNPMGTTTPITMIGPINCIRLSPSLGNFDAGTVTLIGTNY